MSLEVDVDVDVIAMGSMQREPNENRKTSPPQRAATQATSLRHNHRRQHLGRLLHCLHRFHFSVRPIRAIFSIFSTIIAVANASYAPSGGGWRRR